MSFDAGEGGRDSTFDFYYCCLYTSENSELPGFYCDDIIRPALGLDSYSNIASPLEVELYQSGRSAHNHVEDHATGMLL